MKWSYAFIATQVCFSQTALFTHEVLAVVMQQMVDMTPIPQLFLRTVMQALGQHPTLTNFVMTILARLVSKQLWKDPVLWVGFLKCCQKTAPHSFQVLLQLQPSQLEEFVKTVC